MFLGSTCGTSSPWSQPSNRPAFDMAMGAVAGVGQDDVASCVVGEAPIPVPAGVHLGDAGTQSVLSGISCSLPHVSTLSASSGSGCLFTRASIEHHTIAQYDSRYRTTLSKREVWISNSQKPFDLLQDSTAPHRVNTCQHNIFHIHHRV